MRTARSTSVPSATQPATTLPPSVLDQLRHWRMKASLRFVGKSLRSSPPPPKVPRR